MPANAETVSNLGAGSNVIVCPFYSLMDASANASISFLQQEKVVMAYDEKYEIQLTDASSAAILNAFQLVGNGATLRVDMRAGAQGAFETMMKCVVDNATHAGDSLQTVLYNDVKNQIKSVYGDLAANVLESSWKLHVDVNSTAGAGNLYDDLNDASGQRLMLAQQIPNATFLVYKVGGNTDASENLVSDALLLASGDKIVFLFDITAISTSRVVTPVSDNSPAGSSLSNGASGAANASATGSNLTANQNVLANGMTTLRKIAAFEIQVGAGGGGRIDGLAVAPEGGVEGNMIGAPQTGEVGTAPQTGVDASANQ